MTDENARSATPVTQFARSWIVTFLKILIAIIAVVVGFTALLLLLTLPINVGIWLETGCGPHECFGQPVPNLSMKWWYAQAGWGVMLLAAALATMITWGKIND